MGYLDLSQTVKKAVTEVKQMKESMANAWKANTAKTLVVVLKSTTVGERNSICDVISIDTFNIYEKIFCHSLLNVGDKAYLTKVNGIMLTLIPISQPNATTGETEQILFVHGHQGVEDGGILCGFRGTF